MKKTLLAAGVAAIGLSLVLASCGNPSDPKLNQTGGAPDLPGIKETLVPAMKISPPAGWNGETPTVPQGFTVSAFATDLKIPRQMLILPNGDVLVAEGRGGHAARLRPKDVIAGFIKKQGNTKISGGDRITLLRDADNDGVPELRSVLVENLDAPYGLAYVEGYLYVAEQGALTRFAFQPGRTGIATPGERVTVLPSRINHHWTKSLAASADGTRLYVGIGSNSNIGERGLAVEEERAVVWEIDRATGARRTIATGTGSAACPRLPDPGARRRLLWLALQLLGPESRSAREAAESGHGRRGRQAGLRPGVSCRRPGSGIRARRGLRGGVRRRRLHRHARQLEP